MALVDVACFVHNLCDSSRVWSSPVHSLLMTLAYRMIPGAHEGGVSVGRSVYPPGDRDAGHARLEHDARHPERALLHRPRLEREVSYS